MRNHYKNDPYNTRAKYRSLCPDCGKPIVKGDSIIVWPSARKGNKARHAQCSEADYGAFVGAAHDEYVLTRGMY